MNAAVSTASTIPQAPTWRELYTAAILEVDSTAIPRRITVAQEAILERSKKLFQNDENEDRKERDALDNALRMLHLFRSVLVSTPKAGSSLAPPSRLGGKRCSA